MNSKDKVDFAMLFTLREIRKTSDPVFSRDRGNLTYYSFTLDALALKPSNFCNVRVVSANRIDRLARTPPLKDSRSRPRALPRHRRKEASHIPPLPRLCPRNCVSSEHLCLYRSSGCHHIQQQHSFHARIMTGRVDRSGDDDDALVFGRFFDIADTVAIRIVGVPAL